MLILVSSGIGNPTFAATSVMIVGQDSSNNTRPLSDSSSLGTWYHDCSNLTAFSGLGDDSWTHHYFINVSFGALVSSGDFIDASSTGTGETFHGPLNYHTLSNSFPFSVFSSFEATIEFDAISADRFGWVIVSIHDTTHRPIISLIVNDGWTALDRADAGASWTSDNGSRIDSPMKSGDTVQEPYYETIRALQNSTGVYVVAPRIGVFKLLDCEDTNSSRTVEYVSVQIASYSTYPVCETMRIHDIRLTWGAAESTSSTSLPTSIVPAPSPLVIGAMGAIFVGFPAGIVVGIALSRLHRRGKVTSESGTIEPVMA